MSIDEGEGDEPVRASQCAFAVVVPLTWADFVSDLELDGESNFARSYLPSVRSAHVKWKSYEPTAAAIRRLIGEAERLGATVTRRAHVGHFASLLRDHRVVTLVTHTWLFRPVTAAEIQGAAGLFDLLDRPSNALREALRDRLSSPAPAGVKPEAWEPLRARLTSCKTGDLADERPIAADMASALTSLLLEAQACFGRKRLRPVPELDPIRLLPWTRPVLEAELSGHLKPAKTIEFAGGMITIPDLLAAVPPEYDGVIDLSTCNSLFLAEPIKQASPRATVVWNRMLARLLPCVQRYIFILRELEKGPSSYVDTFLRVTAALRDP